MTPLDNDINPGILNTVQWLRSHGFNTVDSGDGKTHLYECDLPVPYVHILVRADDMASECKRLAALLREKGITVEPMNQDNSVPCIQCHWDVSNNENEGAISMYNVVIPAISENPSQPALPMDDDLNEPLGQACSRENPECESCT